MIGGTVVGICCLLLLLAVPQAAAFETVENGIYQVHVQEAADGIRPGSWNAVTGAGHPVGGGFDILYRSNTVRATNFSSLRIYRSPTSFTDYAFGVVGGATSLDPLLFAEGPSPLAAEGWRTEWRIEEENLRIVQDVLVVGTTLADSAIYHTVLIENQGNQRVRLGWRNLYDWSTGDPGANDDGPTNQLESRCGTVLRGETSTEFSERPVTAGWARVKPRPGAAFAYDTLLSLGFDPGFRPDLPVTVPDEYAFVHWPSASGTAFDYSDVPIAGLADSAGLSWFGRSSSRARSIRPGGSVRFTQALFATPPEDCPVEPPQCAPVPYRLAGWWPFDEPDQGTSGVFADLARNHDGIARFAPDSIGGVVGRAASFDGNLDEVEVADHADLDFPAGTDLSIDFWIRTTDGSGVHVLLEKRATDLVGYLVYLSGGAVGLQLADGGGGIVCSSDPAGAPCTNYGSGVDVADGEWHFVAVTVDRDQTAGGTWYVDGAPVGQFNPTVRSGSLANDEPLLIGQGNPDAPFAGAPFTGDLDEIEITRRVLRPAEVSALYQAGSAGKCKVTVDAPWDQPLCLGQDAVFPQLTVCNEGVGTGRFVFDFAGLPPRPTGVPHGELCEAPGPTQFQVLGQQPLEVLEGQCATARVRISDPAAVTSGEASCYQVTATDLVSGSTNTEFGFIPRSNRICCTPSWPVFGVPSTLDTPTTVTFDVQDTGLGGGAVDLQVEAFQGVEGTPPALRLGDAAPGEPITRQVVFGPDGRGRLEVPVTLTEDFAPLTPYDLVVSGDVEGDAQPELLASATVLPTADPCGQGLNQLCLNQSRFQVRARWRTAQGAEGVAQAVPLTTDTGFLWFFNDSNLELVVKVLDACGFSNRYWVFAGGLTNVEVELEVTDVLAGVTRSYQNPLNMPFRPIQDTDAFATCELDDGGAAGPPPAVDLVDPVESLPLNDERFVVEVEWETPQGASGSGQGVPVTSDTGYFWFFQDSNVELVVKVLDACGFSNRYWVFAGGPTNVQVTMTVTDTVAGTSKTYSNPLGSAFQPIQDTDAFATCP